MFLLELTEDSVFVICHKLECKDISRLNDTIKRALEYPGFALVDIFQECIAFGKQLKS